MTTKNSAVAHLKQNGYFSLPVADLSFAQKMEHFDSLWQEFLAQPLEVKQRHAFANDNGYEYKGPDNPDYKENFHLSLGYELPEASTDIDKAFIAIGKSILRDIVPTVRDVMDVVQEESGIDMFTPAMRAHNEWILRSLYYPPDIPGKRRDFLALPHIDKGMTIHLDETNDGLEIKWDGQWVKVPGRKGYVHGYAGMLGQYHSECHLKALCHQVVSTPVSQQFGRRSHVIFIDHGDVRYNKAKFGSTQTNFPNGENYTMSFEEFKQYFIAKEFASV